MEGSNAVEDIGLLPARGPVQARLNEVEIDVGPLVIMKPLRKMPCHSRLLFM